MHSAISEAVSDMPLFVLLRLLFQQCLGLPLYLLFNLSGQPHYAKRGLVSHLLPGSQIFKARDFWNIVISDAALAVVGGGLFWWGRERGSKEVVAMWLIPCESLSLFSI